MIRLNLTPFNRYLSYLTLHNDVLLEASKNYDHDPDEYLCKSALSLKMIILIGVMLETIQKSLNTNTKFGMEMKNVLMILVLKRNNSKQMLFILSIKKN
jgi:hypothetical protein